LILLIAMSILTNQEAILHMVALNVLAIFMQL